MSIEIRVLGHELSSIVTLTATADNGIDWTDDLLGDYIMTYDTIDAAQVLRDIWAGNIVRVGENYYATDYTVSWWQKYIDGLDDIAIRTNDTAFIYGVDVAVIREVVANNLGSDLADHHRQALAALKEWGDDHKSNIQ